MKENERDPTELLCGCPGAAVQDLRREQKNMREVELHHCVSRKKLSEILKKNNIKSVTVAILEVPCCFGLYQLVSDAVKESKKEIPLKKYTIGIKGDLTPE